MVIKDMRDIERDRRERDRAKMKENITDDIDDVMSNLFDRFKGESEVRKRERKKNEGFLIKLLKGIGIVALVLFIINFLLGNIWLLRYFIKSFFP